MTVACEEHITKQYLKKDELLRVWSTHKETTLKEGW